MPKLGQPLSNAQLEILKAFSYELSEEELIEFRAVIAQYFAQRAINAANNSWDEQKWDDDKVDQLLNTKLRQK